MARPRTGYGYEQPARRGGGGSVFVLVLGLALMLVSVGGGVFLASKAGLIPGLGAADETAAGGDTAQVCADVRQHNTQYPQQLTDVLLEGLRLVVEEEKVEEAEKKLEALEPLTKEWTAKLKEDAAKTDNAELKKVINDQVGKLENLQTNNLTLNDLKEAAKDVNDSLAGLCPAPSGGATSGAAPTGSAPA